MSSELRQRQPRVEDPRYLIFLRTKPCCVCGGVPVEAAHVRMRNPAIGKPSAGLGVKPDDRYAVPLCAYDHRIGPQAQHKGSEYVFWQRVQIDPFAVAAKLYAEYELSKKNRNGK